MPTVGIYVVFYNEILAYGTLCRIQRARQTKGGPSIHSQCGRPDQTLRFSDLASLLLSHGSAQPRVCMCVAITTIECGEAQRGAAASSASDTYMLVHRGPTLR